MEDLKQYRDAWQHQKHADNQVNADTITKMIHRNSSSVVKWIFYISIIEFIVLTLLNVFIKTDWDELQELGLYHFLIGISIFGYIITAIFIYLFYKNYKTIRVTDTAKELITSILNTRKTVKYYIISNLIIIAFSLIYSTHVILQAPEYADIMNEYGSGNLLVWIIVIIFVLFFVGIILLIYLLLYGFLIRRLNSNYKELMSNK